ncbi:MAG TPA: hypothetical protein VFT96_02285 [Gemmatimonadaceae bacterium]|jgi:hypothetical protein|nr:hypothetical protein [Gemmatimonadaceae bacterium]
MAQLTHQQYDQLERAILDATRIAVYRRGTEYILIPLRIGLRGGRESIEARNPTTGDSITLHLDELDSIEFVR